MVSPIDSLEAPGEPPIPTGVPAAQIQGRSPWYLAWLRLRRNKVALACAVAVRADRVVLPGGAAVGRTRGAHRTEREPPHRQGDDRRAGDRRRRARRHAAGARAARQVPARRRPERPRCHGAADVRRPDIDLRRACGGGGHDDPGRDRRPAGRLLPRLDRLGAVADDGRHLGIPRAAARHRAGHHAVHRWPEGRPDRRSQATRSGYRS